MTQRDAARRVEKSADVLVGGIREAARRLGIAERKAYRMAERGEYPFSAFTVRCGSVYVVPKVAFARFLSGELPQNTNAPTGEAKANAAR